MGLKTYRVNEIFYSLQGEGHRVGCPSIFLRFSGCNLKCAKATHGFDCDTEWMSGTDMTAEQIIDAMRVHGACDWVVITGGEPLLQLDDELIDALKDEDYMLAIETNGTKPIPQKIDYVCVSPKVAEHAVKPTAADELRYVRAHGQGIPKPSVVARHLFLSPACDGPEIDQNNLRWCIKLCLENPEWRLSVQTHKIWGIR